MINTHSLTREWLSNALRNGSKAKELGEDGIEGMAERIYRLYMQVDSYFAYKSLLWSDGKGRSDWQEDQLDEIDLLLRPKFELLKAWEEQYSLPSRIADEPTRC